MSGALYVVATPIGNLEDLTLRALRVLKEVDLIACEDTRRTRQLLARYGISTAVTSYFEGNKLAKGERLLRLLGEGKSVALVTDAGTPGISDPGFLLVKEARAAGIKVVPVPGPSALAAALSAAGIPADRFAFEGFLPARSGRRLARLRALKGLETPVVIYEGPHRLLKTLQAIADVFGEVPLVVARELTKQFEEIREGPPSAQLAYFGARAIRGEFTIVISPHRALSRRGGEDESEGAG
ncbi:MAG: 16S rRNA (cytidine(1402)-2'-O)-methyltransferase [Candidatus Rokubacteria bacterium]|nr:16S rRNA (cytidine(1402)-2'-O)-methyltransferase [Candidatus Rokubacteria bacterium]